VGPGSAIYPINLTESHATVLTDCIRQCDVDPRCNAVTYKFVSAESDEDNCWLKMVTSPRHDAPHSGSEVLYVSMDKARTCEQVKADLANCEYNMSLYSVTVRFVHAPQYGLCMQNVLS
jgi:hypothetical protein